MGAIGPKKAISFAAAVWAPDSFLLRLGAIVGFSAGKCSFPTVARRDCGFFSKEVLVPEYSAMCSRLGFVYLRDTGVFNKILGVVVILVGSLLTESCFIFFYMKCFKSAGGKLVVSGLCADEQRDRLKSFSHP